MSNKNTHFRQSSISFAAETPSNCSDAPLTSKFANKRHLPETNPSIFTKLSPLPFPPTRGVQTSSSLFPEMHLVLTPLPKKPSHIGVEGEFEELGCPIAEHIIFESSAEDNNNSSEESSDLEDMPTPTEHNPSAQGSSEPSDSRSPEEDERWKKEENKRRASKVRNGSLAMGIGPVSTPSGKRIQCNCRKSRCLKLYCDCFRLNLTCDGCNCVGCHNLETYAEERSNAIIALMDRNPDPFGLKIEDHKHVKGCNCKKSGCLKKYCECYQAGLSCGENCKCQDCKNVPPPAHDESEPERPVARMTAKKERRMVEI